MLSFNLGFYLGYELFPLLKPQDCHSFLVRFLFLLIDNCIIFGSEQIFVPHFSWHHLSLFINFGFFFRWSCLWSPSCLIMIVVIGGGGHVVLQFFGVDERYKQYENIGFHLFIFITNGIIHFKGSFKGKEKI